MASDTVDEPPAGEEHQATQVTSESQEEGQIIEIDAIQSPHQESDTRLPPSNDEPIVYSTVATDIVPEYPATLLSAASPSSPGMSSHNPFLPPEQETSPSAQEENASLPTLATNQPVMPGYTRVVRTASPGSSASDTHEFPLSATSGFRPFSVGFASPFLDASKRSISNIPSMPSGYMSLLSNASASSKASQKLDTQLTTRPTVKVEELVPSFEGWKRRQAAALSTEVSSSQIFDEQQVFQDHYRVPTNPASESMHPARKRALEDPDFVAESTTWTATAPVQYTTGANTASPQSTDSRANSLLISVTSRQGRSIQALDKIIPAEFRTIPGGGRESSRSLWVGVVRYKKHLGGQTSTKFDHFIDQPLPTQTAESLGKLIRNELLIQMPPTGAKDLSRAERFILLGEQQLHEIQKLQGHLAQRPTQGPLNKRLKTEDGGCEGTKKPTMMHGTSQPGSLLLGMGSSGHGQTLSARAQTSTYHVPVNSLDKFTTMPKSVVKALAAVQAQVARVSQADWKNPYAAVVWGQIIGEDLRAATQKLKDALAGNSMKG